MSQVQYRKIDIRGNGPSALEGSVFDAIVEDLPPALGYPDFYAWVASGCQPSWISAQVIGALHALRYKIVPMSDDEIRQREKRFKALVAQQTRSPSEILEK
jgi:hypothetical protein